jgi:hypothetical protein
LHVAVPRGRKPAAPAPAPAKKADDPNAARLGEVLMIMHGERERRAGRPPYERGILLDRLLHGGWMVVGLPDNSIKHLRGEQVNFMGTCDAHMKYMRVPAEAVTEIDQALRAHFERIGKLHVAKETAVRKRGASKSPPDAKRSAGAGNSENGDDVAAVVPGGHVSRYTEPIRAAAATAYFQHFNPNEVFAGQRLRHQPGKRPLEDDEDPDPCSIYALADYGNTSLYTKNTDAKPATVVTAVAPEGASISTGPSDATDNTGWQEWVEGSNGGAVLHKTRPSRFPARSSTSAEWPLNFQEYTATTFGHKMNDVMAAACLALPQEVALLRGLLHNAEKEAQGKTNLLCTMARLILNALIVFVAYTAESGDASQCDPQPMWLLSVLYPASPTVPPALMEMRAALANFLVGIGAPTAPAPEQPAAITAAAPTATQLENDTVASTASSSGSAPAAPAASGISAPLAAKLLTDHTFEGVNEVTFGAAEGEGVRKRYTFELPAGNKSLVVDLGINTAVVAAGLHMPSAWPQVGPEAQGVVLVGYFSSALEAALVREQVLGLTKTARDVLTSYGVEARSNFSLSEWAELKRISKALTKFHKKYCLP